MKGLDLFNFFETRLRVSITHNCQLKCVFCHQEAIEDHWKPIYMDLNFFKKLISAYKNIGGKEVNLTGGEPTLHPRVSDFINIAYNNQWKLALCTNGLRLDRVFENIKDGKISQIKLSVHETNTKRGKLFLGKAYYFERIEKNILNALELGANMTINFTHTESNTEAFRQVLEKSIKWETDLLIIDLITTRWNENLSSIGHIASSVTEEIISKLSTFKRIVEDKSGCKMKIYESPSGNKWTIKDISFGRLYSDMCKGCNLRKNCGEGIFSLRVDCHGNLKPCLLRKDLERKVKTYDGEKEIQEMLINMSRIMFPSENYLFE